MQEQDDGCSRASCCAVGCQNLASSSPKKKAKTCLHSIGKGERWQKIGLLKKDATAYCEHNGSLCFVACGQKRCMQRMKSLTRPVSSFDSF